MQRQTWLKCFSQNFLKTNSKPTWQPASMGTFSLSDLSLATWIGAKPRVLQNEARFNTRSITSSASNYSLRASVVILQQHRRRQTIPKTHFPASGNQYPTWESLRKHSNGAALIAGYRNPSSESQKAGSQWSLSPGWWDVTSPSITQLASQVDRLLWRTKEQQKRQLGQLWTWGKMMNLWKLP